MSHTLKNNAYHILGLDISASEKDILKRSKEIINRLRVDDVPSYDLDVGLFKDFRTEDAVKEALQRLQAPKKKIKEYFFWIQIADSIDEQALGLLKQKNYLDAIRVWQKAAEGQSTKAFFYKKNLAILYCLTLAVEDNKEYLQNSLIAWKELVDSDKFWASFSKVYKLHDEQIASEDIVSDFKGHVVEYLTDIYTELYHLHKHSDYINEFQKVFSAKGQKVEKSVLGPAYQAISIAVEKLEKLKVSEDGTLDKEEKKTIKELIGLIRSELNKLIDLGLYNDSKTKVMRDRAATAIRSLSIDLHNDLNETEVALGLAKIAEEISGTESSKNKVQADVATLQSNLAYKTKEEAYNKVLDPILQKVKAGKSDRAIEEINQAIYNSDTDLELKKILQELKQKLEERTAKHGKPISSAPSMFTLNGCGTRIYGDTLYFVLLFVPVIPIARYTVENHGNGSYSFLGKLELHKWQKYWQYAIIGIIGIWILSAVFSG
ncbi:MAG: hypothetical protein FJY91_02340 [Candidatus Harrisonbacteria bacterium]|nr:hypothetical protein [Candidatus Harrisonbacteria bacterium]